jgi:hypothetical protein
LQKHEKSLTKTGAFLYTYRVLDKKKTMDTSVLIVQMEFLKMQIDLEETNYRYAVELQKDYDTLRRMRESIRILKEELNAIEEILRQENMII